MSQRWYYQLFGEEFGPVTEPQLRQLREEGTLADDDPVRQEALQEWLVFAEVFSFTSDSGAGEIADLSELAFSFEESGTSTRRAANEITDLSELAFSFEDSGPSTHRNSDKADGIPGRDTVEPAGGGRLPVTSVPEPDSPLYYCLSLGQTLGPMPIGELAGMAESGSLDEFDPVRCGKSGDWVPAGEVPELAAALMLADGVMSAPAKISSATLKRMGETAAVAAASASVNPSVATPPEQLAVSPQTQPEIKARASETQGLPVLKKKKTRKRKNGEDALLDEIFDEVFVEEEKPAKPTPSVYSAAVTAPVASAMEPAIPIVSSPIPIVSSPVSVTASAAAAALRSSPAPIPSLKKSRSDFSLPMPGKGIIIAVALFAATAGFIYKFGIPGFAISYAAPAEYPARLKAVIAEYKALGADHTLDDWKSYSTATRAEFDVYFKRLTSGEVSDAKAKACMPAMKILFELISMGFSQKAFREQSLSKLEKAVLESGI